MSFYPNVPEYLWLALHSQRMREAEKHRLVKQLSTASPSIFTQIARGIRECWERIRISNMVGKFTSSEQLEVKSDKCVGNLGEVP